MKLKSIPNPNGNPCFTGKCDRCGTTITTYRVRGVSGDFSCRSCDAIYNAFGQRLRDDLYSRPMDYLDAGEYE